MERFNRADRLAGLDRRGISRLQFLSALGVGALTLAGCGDSGGSSGTTAAGTTAAGTTAASGSARGGAVNLWTWADYWAPESLKGFTRATGTKINQSNFTSNDLMFSKLNSASGSSFDIAIATGGWIPRLVDVDAIQEIDTDRLPMDLISTDLQGQNYDPEDAWSIPKDYGVQGIIYDPAVVRGEIRTWQDVLDAGAQPGVSGKVSMSNTADELIGTGMWSLGLDWNSEDEEEIRRGADVMKEFGKHVKAYEAGPVDGMVSGQFVMGAISHGAARNARLQNPKLRFVVPGPQTEIWVDTYIMPKGGPSPDQAYAFIEFMLQPEQQIADTAFIGYPTVLPGLVDKLPSSVKLADEIFVSPEILEMTSSRIVNPKTQGLVAQLANEIVGAS